MAVDDLDLLRSNLPALFSDVTLPDDWDDNWLTIPIDDPEAESPVEMEVTDIIQGDVEGAPALNAVTIPIAPDLGALSYPGSPSTNRWSGYALPPDALAFYLPFHYFHPTWWGVYLLLEGVNWLARVLSARSGGELGFEDAIVPARLFLFAHEAFHHSAECFATRLEITHRQPLYRPGIERLFQRTYGTADCLEEALASAHGYRKVRERALREPESPAKRRAALLALKDYFSECPPGYNRAPEFLGDTEFATGRAKFAEANHVAALPHVSEAASDVWLSFPHAFTGISRVNSRVNYLIRADSPLAARKQLGLRYLRYRDVADRLRAAGCQEVRSGNGSHVVWRGTSGRRFPVPRHPGDLRPGTLAKIIRQAGLSMSLSAFTSFPT